MPDKIYMTSIKICNYSTSVLMYNLVIYHEEEFCKDWECPNVLDTMILILVQYWNWPLGQKDVSDLSWY